MSTKEIRPLRDNTSHQRYSNSDRNREGRGANTRLLMGRINLDLDLRIRSFVKFDTDPDWWSDVEEVTEAYLTLTLAGDGDLINGNQGAVSVWRLTTAFSEEAAVNFSSGSYQWPSMDTSVYASGYANTSVAGETFDIDIIKVLRYLAPKGVAFPGGKNGLAKTNHGFALRGLPESATSSAIQVWSSEHSVVGERPTLTIVYRKKNTKPTIGLVTPAGEVSAGFSFGGTFLDDDEGDHLTKVQVQVRKASIDDWDNPVLSVTKEMTDTLGEWTLASFTRTGLKRFVDYEARARGWDRKGAASEWTSPVNEFTIAAASPTATANAIGSVPTMDGLVLGGAFTVDPVTEPVSVDLQVGPRGFASVLWSLSYPMTLPERQDEEVAHPYEGPPLKAGLYSWRFRVTDAVGGVSSWATDDTLQLTVSDPQDDELELTTGYSNVKAAHRIVLYDMRASDRGPGRLVGILEDAANIGFSAYATAPGELYFTLPTTHPQVSVVEPMRTHYSFQQYRQGRWKELGAGLIRDFDAKDDDMVAYGVDYLGLLSLTIEAAKQPQKSSSRNIPTKVTGTDGSRYFKKTIRSIIVDQLKRARGQDPASPVKFIQTGRIDAFDTKVTIYASFAERLSFIRGLIDSHKGAQANGEERRSRVRVRWNPAADGGQGRYQFEALDAVGKDRPNIRLEYGSLIQGYRVIALEDFATRVYGIGKVPNHALPHFKAVDAPGISQTTWGSIGRANFWNDLVDEQDLTRRARNMATRLSRIGKRIALGLRVSGIDVFDGYDILDSFPVSIEDGVVSTSQYGALIDGYTYWTLWGVEYRLFPDEHDEVTFILRPKGSTAAIDADLIPSTPIHNTTDWAWGAGPPA